MHQEGPHALRRILGLHADLQVIASDYGLDEGESTALAERHRRELGALGARRVAAVDAAASFSRPGPRLVDGVERLAELLVT